MLLDFDNALNSIQIFLLVFARMTGLFVIAPIFGRRSIPAFFKVILSFLCALLICGTVRFDGLPAQKGVLGFAMAVLLEFLAGIIIGFVSFAILSAVYVAGEIIDMQIGFGIVNIIDPVSNVQAPITSNFYMIIATLFMLIFNGHHMLLKALFESFEKVEPGFVIIKPEIVYSVSNIMSSMFTTGFKIAVPVTVVMLVTDVVLGVLSKTVPQINVFVVGMPLKILLGFFILLFCIPVLTIIFKGMSGEMSRVTSSIIEGISKP